eukprot:jgi/Ulvmu1/12833/UM098_0015.1
MQSSALQEALHAAGLQHVSTNLGKHSIKEAEHVVECSIVDIIHLGQATYSQADFLLKTAAALLAPRCVPLRRLLHAERCNSRLSLGLPNIDVALGNGLLVGAITELVGPAGIGKSQLCMSLAARACLPQGLDAAVVYIDTEMKFKEKRLLQIMKAHLTKSAVGSECSSSYLNTLGKRMHVIQPKTGLELMNVLQRLPVELSRRSVGLVIVDSIAMLARLEFSQEDIPRRQRVLAQQAALLKRSAEQFNLTVVVTNQITGGQGNGSGDGQRAALGVVWSHAVNTRLVMEQRNGINCVRVAKCPVCGPQVAGYSIGEAGIMAVEQQLPCAPVQSVLDANISAEHHVQEAGQPTQYQ